MRMRALLFEIQDFVDVINSRKLLFSKRHLCIFTGSALKSHQNVIHSPHQRVGTCASVLYFVLFMMTVVALCLLS